MLREIFVNHKLPGAALIGEALSTRMGHNVKLHKPQRGDKMNLMRHGAKRQRGTGAASIGKRQSTPIAGGVAELLATCAPERIEVFDNSHLQGINQLGGMIVAGLTAS